jgi:hypothetical protein
MSIRIFKSTAFSPINPNRVRLPGYEYHAFPVSACLLAMLSSPEDVEIFPGEDATFLVLASSTSPMTYQWQVSVNGGADWSDLADAGVYSGVTTTQMAITSATPGMADYLYRCVVTNICTSKASNYATLTITPPSLAGSAFASDEGTASLGGISELDSPNVPPKKYRKQELGGAYMTCFHHSVGCGGPIYGTDAQEISGLYEYDAITLAVTNTQLGDILGITGQCASAYSYGNTFPIALLFTNIVASGNGGQTVVTTQTRQEATRNGCIVAGAPGDAIKYQTKTGGAGMGWWRQLSIEDTEDDAIVRSVPSGSGTSPISYRETRGAGDFSFSWQDSTFSATATDLVSGFGYEVAIDILTENYGGGGGVTSQIIYPFTATGTTEPILIPIPCAPGKQVTASNPTISIV